MVTKHRPPTKAQQWSRKRNPAYFMLCGHAKQMSTWAFNFEDILTPTEETWAHQIVSQMESLRKRMKKNSSLSKEQYMNS